ncbi:hypothetical protein GGX14DRAFT_555015 [Mycena pura]|uniref:Uncharacterized protein n=1 Tax=Mycena pura TaxID=153505 RepID=A0AAD7E4Y3_9AGAR|nr:hypothetical protein GGX14DRAFT_555015 [Mycena pura]
MPRDALLRCRRLAMPHDSALHRTSSPLPRAHSWECAGVSLSTPDTTATAKTVSRAAALHHRARFRRLPLPCTARARSWERAFDAGRRRRLAKPHGTAPHGTPPPCDTLRTLPLARRRRLANPHGATCIIRARSHCLTPAATAALQSPAAPPCAAAAARARSHERVRAHLRRRPRHCPCSHDAGRPCDAPRRRPAPLPPRALLLTSHAPDALHRDLDAPPLLCTTPCPLVFGSDTRAMSSSPTKRTAPTTASPRPKRRITMSEVERKVFLEAARKEQFEEFMASDECQPLVPHNLTFNIVHEAEDGSRTTVDAQHSFFPILDLARITVNHLLGATGTKYITEILTQIAKHPTARVELASRFGKDQKITEDVVQDFLQNRTPTLIVKALVEDGHPQSLVWGRVNKKAEPRATENELFITQELVEAICNPTSAPGCDIQLYQKLLFIVTMSHELMHAITKHFFSSNFITPRLPRLEAEPGFDRGESGLTLEKKLFTFQLVAFWEETKYNRSDRMQTIGGLIGANSILAPDAVAKMLESFRMTDTIWIPWSEHLEKYKPSDNHIRHRISSPNAVEGGIDDGDNNVPVLGDGYIVSGPSTRPDRYTGEDTPTIGLGFSMPQTVSITTGEDEDSQQMLDTYPAYLTAGSRAQLETATSPRVAALPPDQVSKINLALTPKTKAGGSNDGRRRGRGGDTNEEAATNAEPVGAEHPPAMQPPSQPSQPTLSPPPQRQRCCCLTQ